MTRHASKAEDLTPAKAGEVVFREGEAGEDVFIIQDGEVDLLKARGAHEDRLARLAAGDFFGEAVLGGERTRPMTARAVSDSTLLRLDPASFAAVVQQRPEIAARMIGRLTQRLLRSLEAALPPPAAEAPARAAAQSRPAAGRPRLVHVASGAEFVLPAQGEALVGRADPRSGFNPDFEMSSLDAHRSLSRRHARVGREGEGFFVCEESRVANGTFVNGTRLKVGVPQKIQDGDELSFGQIKTVFHAV
jgi:hypothetical protein